MRYPSFESRLSREQATQTLLRICERLDECSTATIPRRFSKAPPAVVNAVRLWVVGSYARGALTCGDVDVVMELDNHCFADRKLNRQLLKSPPRVSLYTGTPEDNSSQASFAEAVLVWEPGLDWRAAVEAIKPNEGATRFDRPTDRIPLRMDQLSGCGLWFAEPAVERLERQELAWRFVPLDDLCDDVKQAAEDKEQADLLEWATRRRIGSDSRRLLPYLLAYVRRSSLPKADWMSEFQTRLQYGSTEFYLGVTPSLEVLDETGVNEIVVMPHLSSRGPNGLWVINRGPQHPLVRAFEGCEAWTVVNHRKELDVVHWSGISAQNGEIVAANIFESQQEALDYIERESEAEPFEPGEERYVRELKGKDILEVLDNCLMLDGGLCWTVFSEKGRREARYAGFDEDALTVCSIGELAETFRPKPASVTAAGLPECPPQEDQSEETVVYHRANLPQPEVRHRAI